MNSAVYRSLPIRRYHGRGMKPQPAPYVPGDTDAERMDNAVRKMFSVSKEDYLKEEERLKLSRARKRTGKKTA